MKKTPTPPKLSKKQRVEMMLRRIEKAQERARTYVKCGESLVDELLAERREAAVAGEE